MKTLTTATITDDDLWYILNNPWAVSKAEWGLGDDNSRTTIYSYLKELLALTEDSGYSEIWRTDEGTPIAILGCYPISKKKFTTFLVCSDLYEAYALQLSFKMRKTLKEAAVHYKGCTIGIYSSSEHPHLFTWLRFLKFHYLPEGNKGDWRYFEYTSKVS